MNISFDAPNPYTPDYIIQEIVRSHDQLLHKILSQHLGRTATLDDFAQCSIERHEDSLTDEVFIYKNEPMGVFEVTLEKTSEGTRYEKRFRPLSPNVRLHHLETPN